MRVDVLERGAKVERSSNDDGRAILSKEGCVAPAVIELKTRMAREKSVMCVYAGRRSETKREK